MYGVVAELRKHMLENASVLAAAGADTTPFFRRLTVDVTNLLSRLRGR